MQSRKGFRAPPEHRLDTRDMSSGINNNDGSSSRIRGPSVGAYAMWVNGGFSIDSTFKADLSDLDQTTAGVLTPLGLTNYVSALNFNQKSPASG
jgi:hypothetical protein